MASLPSGAVVAVATAFGTSKTVTAITNAAEAVVSSTAHGYSNGDFVIVQSGWGKLNKRCFRIKAVATDSFTLEGCDTTNTTLYPPGSGAGSAVKINTWVQLSGVMNPQSSGGDAKRVTYRFLESDVDYTINDGFNAITASIELDADQIGTPGYTALKTLTDVQTDTVRRITLKSGSQILLPCSLAMNEEVRMQDGRINHVLVDFSGNGRSTRYAS